MSKKDEKVTEVTKDTNKISTPKGKEVVVEGGDMKVKAPKAKPKRPKQLVGDDPEIIKVDMTKKEEEVKEEVEEKIEEQPKKEEVVEEIKEEVKEEEVKEDVETPVLEEIVEDETAVEVEDVKEEVIEAVEETKETGEPLPENIQKVVDFMDETGGSLEDYVRLNQDFSKLEDNELLKEYYQQTKPHLTPEEISFIMEDQFSFDEEVDDPKDIRRKKLALKEQVASAKSHLDGQKSKYYEEVKAGSKLTQDQQKAMDFFNRYNEELEVSQKQATVFQQKTNKVFDDKFKGFEYSVGDKRYRFNVKNINEVKDSQSDINNFVRKFLDKNNTMNDAPGYHKSLFTAMNADAVANHFYEQGKADAIKDSMAKAKNVDMSPRTSHSNVIQSGGMKVRAVSGDDSSKLRVKIGNKIS